MGDLTSLFDVTSVCIFVRLSTREIKRARQTKHNLLCSRALCKTNHQVITESWQRKLNGLDLVEIS